MRRYWSLVGIIAILIVGSALHAVTVNLEITDAEYQVLCDCQHAHNTRVASQKPTDPSTLTTQEFMEQLFKRLIERRRKRLNP